MLFTHNLEYRLSVETYAYNYFVLSAIRMLSFLKELALITGLTLLGIAYSLMRGEAPPPWAAPELEAGEIRLADAAVLEPIWVDARSEAAYTSKHMEGALLLNEANWEEQIIELMGRWLESPRPIVIYCASESCGTSKRIADRLRGDLPDAEIYSLHGGWNE